MPRPGGHNVLKITRSLGIKVLDPDHHSATTNRPKACYCMSTLQRVCKHGESHLGIVLKLIIESRGNESALHASIIHAMSNVVLSGKVTVDSALFDKLDEIDLAALRQWARKARIGPRAGTAEVLTTALMMLLCPPDVAQRQEQAPVELVPAEPLPEPSKTVSRPVEPRRRGWALTRILEAA